MTRWVLSIDGGGIRGIIPALVIAYLEKQTGRPAAELFDLIVGTSTGGILALGLAQPAAEAAGKSRHTAQQLAELYIEKGAAIFDRGWWRRLLRSAAGAGSPHMPLSDEHVPQEKAVPQAQECGRGPEV